MRWIALCGVAALAGCVTAADLEAIKAAQARYTEEVARQIQSMENEQSTQDEVLAALKGAQNSYAASIDAVIDEVAERTKEGTTSLVEVLGIVAGGLATGALGLNTYRNRTRRETVESLKEGLSQ